MSPSSSDDRPPDPGPLNDPQGSKALDRYDVLDSLPHDFLDRITRLAAHLFDASTAYVTFVEAERTRSMTRLGSDEVSRPGITFCLHALQSDGVMVVENATNDDRFSDNPFVTGDPKIRFYAGTPLVTPDGFSIGTLCVMDTAPYSPSAETIYRLEDLADVVVEEMELCRENAQRRADDRERLQSDILEQIAAGALLSDILDTLVTAIEEKRPDMIGSILLYDEDSETLLHTAAPHLPPSYTDAINDLPVGPRQGTCGTAAYENELVVTEDIRQDPRWNGYRDIALQHGLRACWSMPINGSEGQVLGTFAMYYQEPRRPASADEALIDQSCSLARLAIERHRDAETRRRQRQLLDRVVETCPAAIAVLNTDGVFVRANNRAEEILGVDQKDITEQTRDDSAWALRSPEGRSMPEEDLPFARIMASEEPVFGMESLIERSDESERLIRINGAPLYDENRVLAGAVFHLHDITEQREAESALRRSQKKYKALFESSTDAIIVHDLSGTILDVNRQAESLFQMSTDELVGQSLFDLHTTEAEKHAEQKLAALHDGQPFHMTTQYVRSDGSVFWGEVSANVAEVENDVVVWSMVRDVTERKEAVETLREREARLRGFANSIPGVIFQFFARPDGTRGLRFANEQIEPVLGMSGHPDDTFERFLKRIPETHRDAVLASIETAIDDEAQWTEEFPFEKSSDETVWIQGIATPERRQGELVFNGVLLDITERKRTHQQLRQAQKMETVGTLVGGIAHDFNNMLHAATAYVGMAEEEVPDNYEARDFLSLAQKGLHQAEDLVRKLLTFARPDSETRREHVDVASMVRDALDLVEPSFPSDLTVNIELNDGCSVIGNPEQLLQIVVNLVRNGVQAMAEQDPSGSDVLEVHLQQVEVGADLAEQYLNLEPGRYVHLAVSDTGPGMDETTRQRIFDPFFTTKRPGEGTGLGLAVVHGAVQAHDGTISARSEPGEGTTINVYLPDATDQPVETTSGGPTSQEDDEETLSHVLVVDDEESIRDLETVRLRRLGYQVTTRANAEGALEAIRSHPDAYDLVIVDHVMPEMTGLELIRRLRDKGLTLPIVLMSGFGAQVSDENASQVGVDGFLRKPVGTRELDALLSDLLSDTQG